MSARVIPLPTRHATLLPALCPLTACASDAATPYRCAVQPPLRERGRGPGQEEGPELQHRLNGLTAACGCAGAGVFRPPSCAACCRRVAAVRAARPERRRVSVLSGGDRCALCGATGRWAQSSRALRATAGSPPAATAERTRWTLGARSSKPANEELKPDLVTTVRAAHTPRVCGATADTFLSSLSRSTLAKRACRRWSLTP